MATTSLRQAGTYVARALARHCPHCGAGGVFTSWLKMRDVCPTCGFRFDRGEHDHFLGAYLFNFVAAELIFALAFVLTLLCTWPSPPWTTITWMSAGLVVLLPIVTYPFTRGLWIAIDLAFRPDDRSGAEV